MTSVRDRDVLTPEQVADILQIRKDTVYRYIRDRQLPAVKLGRNYRVLREDLDRFLLAHSTREEVRRALFDRVLEIGRRTPRRSPEEVEADVAEAVAAARRTWRG